MQMQNMRITITPQCIYYTSNKPITIILKLKRILISTNYQLQKFQCKKHFILKNNMVDLMGVGQSFGFKLSKEFQLGNTKVDFMVFALMNKDVKLLGIGEFDLGRFQHVENNQLPIQQELKINLQRSEDPHAYITTKIHLEMLAQPQQKNPSTKQTKNQSDGINSLKTQSYNRQSLLNGRRKQNDIPSGYQISKKNYKQVQVTRNNDNQRSRSKSTKQAGSYKKRFQYQSNRSQIIRQGQDHPQVPPNQFPQSKGEAKGSPVPRLKTPEPMSDFQMSSASSIEKNLKKRQNPSPNTQNQHKLDPLNPKNSRNKIKIVVDVYQEHKVIEQSFYDDDDEEIQKPREYKQTRSRQTFKKQVKQTKQQKSYDQQRPLEKSSKNLKNQNQIGKISHIHQTSKQKQQPFVQNNNQEHKIKNPQKKFNQKNESIQYSDKHSDEKLTYQNYRHSQSLQNNDSKINKNTGIQIKNNQFFNQRPSISQNRKQPQPKPTKQQQKQSIRQQSQNKFKSITDKLEQIQHKIKQGKKSQNSPSPYLTKQINSQNTYDGYQDYYQKPQFQARKPYSPYTTKDKNDSGRVQYKKNQKQIQRQRQRQKQKQENLSANTFKENYFQSQHQSSQHVNSFDPMTQSRNKQNGSSSNGLDSIAQETANLSRYSESNIKFGQKQPEITINNQNRRPEGGNKISNPKIQISNVQKQQKKKIQQTVEEPNVYESSVTNFPMSSKDDKSSKRQQIKNQPKPTLPNSKKTSINQSKKNDETNYQQNRKKQQELKDSSTQIKKIYTFKQEQKSGGSIQQAEYLYPLSKLKQIKKKNNNISLEISVKVQPTVVEQKKQSQTKSDSLQKDPKLHQVCQEKIAQLENLLDHQEQNQRKLLLQKDLEYRNMLKSQLAKSLSQQQQQLKSLRNQNAKLKQKQLQYNKSKASLNKNQSKQSMTNSQEVNRLKDQNLRLRNLVDKLNAELEQTDEKHFQALTAVQKKDLQYKRKVQDYAKINAQLLQKLQKRQLELKDQSQKLKKIQSETQQKKQQPIPSPSQKQIKKDASATNIKSYQQQYLAQKKKSVNLQGQLRQKCNQIRFLKIKNDNLLQQKKDLQNQIDNIAINNKLEMAKQGSIAKMNLQAASVTNSVKVENRVLREEINSLQKQVHELNALLEGIIVEGSLAEERVSGNKEMVQRQNGENLEKKYRALQKKAEAYEQEIRQKQLKIAEILNAIFSHGNPKLMDQISKLVGMNQE